MRINMSRWLIAVASIVIIGCSSDNKNEMYGVAYIVLNEQTWNENYTTSYPFTVPEDYTDESYIGTLLNKSAIDGLKLSHLTPSVPYSVKEGADLNEAVRIGLKVCDEYEDGLANS